MAIEYTLMLDTGMDVDGLISLACGIENAEVAEIFLGRHFRVPHLLGAAVTVDEVSRELTRQWFGVPVRRRVTMRLDANALPASVEAMKQVLVRILIGTTCDVVLVHNGEHPVLRRRGAVRLIIDRWGRSETSTFGDLQRRLGATWILGPDLEPTR